MLTYTSAWSRNAVINVAEVNVVLYFVADDISM